MSIGRQVFFPSALALCALLTGLSLPSAAETVTDVCTPKIIANKVLVTAAQRKAAGNRAWPPLTDAANGFAWPDTELGVAKIDGGYVFFGSDGGYHERQLWEDQYYGNNKYGSVTRTIGTLDNPLGTEDPIDVTINPNPDPSVNPFYSAYDYMGGGPVYQVPAGMPGAGKLLMVYHAEIPTVTTQSFYSVFALASSSNGGMSWTDLGEIVRINQGYRTDMDGYDIGDANLVVSPTPSISISIFLIGWPTAPPTGGTPSPFSPSPAPPSRRCSTTPSATIRAHPSLKSITKAGI